MVGKSLTSQQNERVRAAVRELLALHGGSQTKVAPLIGVEQATLSRFLSGVQGTSSHVAMRVASLLGKNPLELLDPTSKSGVVPRSSVDPEYPSRAKAEVAARVMDCSEEDIRGAIAAHVGPDPGDIYWILEFLRARDRRRWAEAAQHPPPHSGDRPTGGGGVPPKTRRSGSPRG